MNALAILVLVFCISGRAYTSSLAREKFFELRDALDSALEEEHQGDEIDVERRGYETEEDLDDFDVEARSAMDLDEICLLVPDPGKCKAAITRYFYNDTSDQCEDFIYGGCAGNENNFETLEKCQTVCKGKGAVAARSAADDEDDDPGCVVPPCTPESLGCKEGVGLATDEDECPICKCKEVGSTTNELTKCQLEQEQAKTDPEIRPPSCDDDGSFSDVQCDKTDCWCVLDDTGAEIDNTRVPIAQKESMKCAPKVVAKDEAVPKRSSDIYDALEDLLDKEYEE